MDLSQARARLIGRLHRRRTREREGLVLAEGVRVVREALDAGAELTFAVASPRVVELGGEPLLDRLAGSGVDVVRIDDDAMRRLAETEAPQGLLAVAREPRPALEAVLRAGRPLLVLDGVQDPGNAGTLVRSAASFALGGVVALDGTVDPWNPKAVRASAGTCFRLPLVLAPWQDVESALVAAGLPLLVADAHGQPVTGYVAEPAWALAVGSEGAGARAGVLAAASARLSVPMPGGTESLNAAVAGAILVFALTTRRSHRGGPRA